MDYQALERALKETQARLEEEQARREKAEAKIKEQESKLEEQGAKLTQTSFHDFLRICHNNIFLHLKIEPNELMRTNGGLTRVDGKVFPRELRPWQDFDSRLETSFALLETIFQQDALFPSPADLGYLERKLRDKQLAGEEDLKNFECLAVEGCTLDILPCFIRQLGNAKHDVTSDSPAMVAQDSLKSISFNNYPYGVIATEEDEDAEEGQQDKSTKEAKVGEGVRANKKGTRGSVPATARRSPSRGRTRQRAGGSRSKPLQIKDDRPAYIGALGVAKRDMDAATARAAAEAEEREESGPPKKRQSPDRSKVHPDQWCFRHNTDNTSRPLFVIEYKAAHKIDLVVLRRALEPAHAATLMRDVTTDIKNSGGGGVSETTVAHRDIAKVFAQTFHYMVDYGLQYCYATTGHALIFLYLDPAQPSTLFYHLEEPAKSADTTCRDGLKHTAVGLVASFVLMALQGQYMTNQWKKAIHKTQPKWPQPYDEADGTPAVASIALTPAIVLPVMNSAAGAGCKDPQKRDNNGRRDQDDDDSGGGGGSKPDPSTSSATSRPAEAPPPSTPATAPSKTANTTGRVTTHGTQQAATWKWWRPADAPLTPTLAYCTQKCLLGLKTGGAKDPHCPNAHLHRRQANGHADGDVGDDSRTGPHPITAAALRQLLKQQLAADLDTDCHSLERFGMYGAIGVLFKLALSAYGYCFVAKGVQRAHYKALQREAAAYELLQACQGRLVPVNLGVIHLDDAYWTECGAHITDMMLLAYAGDSLWHLRLRGACTAVHNYMAELTLDELKQYGVEHGDEDENNLVWNAELQRVLAIDFDRAVLSEAPAADDRRRKASHEQDHAPDTKRMRAN